MRILLDTNIYSELKRGNPTAENLVRTAEQILVSPIVLGELLSGFHLGDRFEQNVDELQEFLESSNATILPIGLATAEQYGVVVAALSRKGSPIPTNDIWIAAQAMESGADLVSADGHFEHVDGIAWVRVAVS